MVYPCGLSDETSANRNLDIRTLWYPQVLNDLLTKNLIKQYGYYEVFEPNNKFTNNTSFHRSVYDSIRTFSYPRFHHLSSILTLYKFLLEPTQCLNPRRYEPSWHSTRDVLIILSDTSFYLWERGVGWRESTYIQGNLFVLPCFQFSYLCPSTTQHVWLRWSPVDDIREFI